jgi:hypothetical protein
MSTFDELRERLPLREVAESEGLKVKPWGRGILFDCPACMKGGRDGSGARARDGVTWRCVRCGEGGDVVDVLRVSRGVDAKGAFREACELAGLRRDERPTERDKRPPTEVRRLADTEEAPSPVGAEDLAERLRAVRFAMIHYRTLADLESDDPDRPTARGHVDFLAELEREGFGATATRSPDGYLVLTDLEADIRKARGYLMQRLGAAWPEVRPVADELVGVCPSADSGLATWLRHHGGDELVEAAKRADLIRPDGRERFAGALVYAWHDLRGRAVYLTGRAVPGLHRDPKAKLCPRAPYNNDAGIGLPLPEVPFGAFLADKLEGPIWICEGEADALHGLAVGPTVATGGAGRMGGARGVEAIKRWLGGREAVVRFDDEADPEKRAEIDRRAMDLARSVGCRWIPTGSDGGIAEVAA